MHKAGFLLWFFGLYLANSFSQFVDLLLFTARFRRAGCHNLNPMPEQVTGQG